MSSNNSSFKRFLPYIGIGVVVALVAFGSVFALRNTTNESVASTASVASNNDATLGSKENPHQVSLTKDQTEPIDLLINVGDYVQFNSKDGGEHQIIQGKISEDHGHDAYADAVHGEAHGEAASPLDSGVFKADEGYLLQFKTIGKFEFHDNYNHDSEITVIVYDKNKKLEDTKIE